MQNIDKYIGGKIGHWTILEDLGMIYQYRIVKVQCICGHIKYIHFAELKRGKSTNCGCQVRNNPLNWIGKKINRLTIIKILEVQNGKTRVQCICDCGKKRIVRFDSLMNKSTSSCGCYGIQVKKKHGQIDHPLYNVWVGMRNRCNDESAKSYKNYGGKGVVVCKEWSDFKNFYEWGIKNGWSKGLQLDKDILAKEIPGKLYSPKTCCFVTRKENMNRTTKCVFIEYKGETKTMKGWSEFLNIPYHVIVGRYHSKWPIDKIFNTPVQMQYSKHREK